MKKYAFIIFILLLTACAPATQPGIFLPIQIATEPAFIDPASYPTSQSADVSASQLTSGINVRVERAWRDGKNVNANVCFSLPDPSDWAIWNASLSYGDSILQEYETTLLSTQNGERCDTLTFVVAPDADTSTAIIIVDAIGTTPRADEYCTVYMPKIQQTLNERGAGIILDCVDNSGLLTMQIVSYPPEMTQEQAEQMVYSDEFYTVKGPWVFTFSLGQ